jgi:aryl-alcohol dehydrogenase-like predicted oxidoreductase
VFARGDLGLRKGQIIMKRRSFLKVAGGCALGSGTLSAFGAQVTAAAGDKKVDLPRRVLGRTGEKVSTIGFPGLSLVQQGQGEGTAGIHKAFDEGINYFDVAPAYGRNGECEIKMGVGLQGLDRSRIFLACKTKKRDQQGAREELERSLTRLKTDHFDLYQMHAVFTPEEAQRALGPGGAIETFLKAKEEGKIRFFGFSAHTTKGALEMMKESRFVSVMFPIDYVDYLNWGFGKTLLEAAQKHGLAVLAMKTLCGGAAANGGIGRSSKTTRSSWRCVSRCRSRTWPRVFRRRISTWSTRPSSPRGPIGRSPTPRWRSCAKWPSRTARSSRTTRNASPRDCPCTGPPIRVTRTTIAPAAMPSGFYARDRHYCRGPAGCRLVVPFCRRAAGCSSLLSFRPEPAGRSGEIRQRLLRLSYSRPDVLASLRSSEDTLLGHPPSPRPAALRLPPGHFPHLWVDRRSVADFARHDKRQAIR